MDFLQRTYRISWLFKKKFKQEKEKRKKEKRKKGKRKKEKRKKEKGKRKKERRKRNTFIDFTIFASVLTIFQTFISSY